MSDWSEARLGDIAEVVDCEHKTAPAAEPGTEYGFSVGTPHIRDGRIDYASAKRVSFETYEAWSRRAELRAGDLILAREAPVGQVGRVDLERPTCLGQRTVLIRADAANVVERYLHAYLLGRDAQQWMADRSAGSTVAHLNVADVREIPVALPPRGEQQRIAGVLGALDDLIETNRSLLPRLEDAARILAARASSETALSAMAAAASGKQAKPVGTVEHYSLPAFDAGVVPEIADAKTIKSSKLRLCGPTVLVSRLNPRWERCWMAFPGDNAMCSTEFVPLIGQGTEPEEIWAVTSSTAFWEQMRALVTGTTGSHQRVDKEAVLTLMVPDVRQLPGADRQRIVDLVRGARDARYEIADLTRARDELLPLLVSGRVRVREVA